MLLVSGGISIVAVLLVYFGAKANIFGAESGTVATFFLVIGPVSYTHLIQHVLPNEHYDKGVSVNVSCTKIAVLVGTGLSGIVISSFRCV